MSKSLQDQLREYYGEQNLSEDRTQQILTLGKEVSAGRPVARQGWYRSYRWRGLAAMLVAGLLIGYATTFLSSASAKVTDEVVSDIASMHRKNLAAEVSGDSLNSLQGQMSFDPKLECPRLEALLPEGMIIVGARYCQVEKELAAQIKLLNPETGARATLYIAARRSSLENLESTEVVLPDVIVRTWNDGVRVFAMAMDRNKG